MVNTANSGGVLVGYRSIVMLKNSSFTNSSAESGGVMRLFSNNLTMIVGCNFRFNWAKYGGILYTQGGNISIQSSTFVHNKAIILGGVLLVSDGGYVSIDNNCTFVQNQVEGNGGVMSLSNNTKTAIHNCMFKNNSATNYGGTIYLQRSNVTISDCTFQSSSARYYGSAINANSW